MGKNDDIEELTNLMSRALRHKIGSMVNKDEIYAVKYAKDAEVIMEGAEKIKNRQNWNNYDKKKIEDKLRKKLKRELAEKDFLNNAKFKIMDEELNKALAEFGLKPY